MAPNRIIKRRSTINLGLFSFIDIDELNLGSSGTDAVVLILLLLLLIVVCLFIYQTRTALGFYLRKTFPIQLFRKENQHKEATRILFIDDNDVPHARTLDDDKWSVKTIRDCDVDHAKVKEANIIFVDWKGVGKRISSESEGISLAENIKRKYGHKKYVVLYSSQEYEKPEGAACVDQWLRKGSSFSKYIAAINKAGFALFS